MFHEEMKRVVPARAGGKPYVIGKRGVVVRIVDRRGRTPQV